MKRVLVLAGVVLLVACQSAPPRPPEIAGVPPTTLEPPPKDDTLIVTEAPEEVIVAAWAEPSHLPPGGGMVQILVRTTKRGGAPFPNVEVRLKASTGALYSQSRVLTTDPRGMTRDRLTAKKTAEIVLNAGGTRYRFDVPVLPESAE